MDFKKIKNINELLKLLDHMRSLDIDANPLELTAEEAKNDIPQDIFIQIDKNKNGKIEVFEAMDAVNHLKGSPIFRPADIKKAETCLGRIEGAKSGAVHLFQLCYIAPDGGTDKLTELAREIKEKDQASGDLTIKALPDTVTGLAESGKKTDEIVQIIREVLSVSKLFGYATLPAAIELVKLGFTIDDIKGIIAKTIEVSGWGVPHALKILMEKITEMEKKGLSPEKITSILLIVLDATAPEIVMPIVPELDALGFTPKEMVRLVEFFVRAFPSGTQGPILKKLPGICRRLLEKGHEKGWIIEQINETVRQLELVAGLAVEYILDSLPEFIALGLDVKGVVGLVKELDSSFDVKAEEKVAIYSTFMPLLKAGFDMKRIRMLFAATAKHAQSFGYHSVATFIHRAIKNWPTEYIRRHFVENWHADGLAMLIKAGQEVSDIFFDLIGQADIDLSRTTTLKGMISELPEKFVVYYSKTPEKDLKESSLRFVSIINKLHDWEEKNFKSDRLRETIIARLSFEDIYKLVSLGSSELYPSTFRKLFNKFMSEPEHLAKMKALDPGKKYTLDFVNTLLKYDRFNELLAEDVEYFRDIISAYFAEKLGQGTLYLATAFKEIFTNKKLAPYKVFFEELLLGFYKKYKKEENLNGWGTTGYFIKLNYMNFSEKNMKEAASIAEYLPESKAPVVPKELYKDGKLTAKLYFYQREHFNLIQSTYRKRGFKIRKIDNDTAAMTKRVGKFGLLVTVTLNNKDVKEILQGKTDIVAHRGHSYQLSQTFNEFVEGEYPQLIYLGSCSSYGDVDGLQKMLPERNFIADRDTGEGVINNNVLYYTMKAMALMETKDSGREHKWEDIEEYVEKRTPEDKGIVYPHHPAFLLSDFLNRLRDFYTN